MAADRHKRHVDRLAAFGCKATPAEALVVGTAEGESVAIIAWQPGKAGGAVVYAATARPRGQFVDVDAAVDAVAAMAGRTSFDDEAVN